MRKKKCSCITYSVVNVTFYLHNMQKELSANCSNLYGMRTKDTDFSKMFSLRNNQEVRTSNLAVKAEVWGIFSFLFFTFAHVYIHMHRQVQTDLQISNISSLTFKNKIQLQRKS